VNALKKAEREYLSDARYEIRDYFLAISRKKLDQNVNDLETILKATYCAITEDEDISHFLNDYYED